MRADDFWAGLVCVGVPFTVVAFFILVNWLKPKKPPMLLGSKLDKLPGGFEPDRRYDVAVAMRHRWEGGTPDRVFVSVRIVGSTEGDAPSKGWWDEWIVLEHPDGRKAFLQRHHIVYIEESAAPGQERSSG